ncbi:PfaD family polyunsaturated fatty acid/polyketide biosynthesis protein [Chromobacterium vaccinii]|uniref:PfaD family polyunsaturated fatty acid/polyketide biosynthesis protein n=1 Tax=Chromobacterium vaccinii TaxID=1108595 RepID=UPI003C78EEC4
MLGSSEFRRQYGVCQAYVAGSMYKGISSGDLVVAMARSGMMGFLGAGGMRLDRVEHEILAIQQRLAAGQAYGVNLLANLDQPEQEFSIVELCLAMGVPNIEASAFMRVHDSLVWYRFKGAYSGRNGEPCARQRVLAKVSQPEVAALFLNPPPESALRRLVAQGRLSASEADIASRMPVASDICVEADSGGHTDRGVLLVLLPAMLRLRERICRERRYAQRVNVGAAGGIGAPEAAAAAFLMGADFIVTGSINQCTVEAGTSSQVKDLLQTVEIGDTGYAPAGDMFELGARVQVVRRGLLFPPRANELYELYRRHASLDELEPRVRQTIQEKYFRRSFDQVWQETREYYARCNPQRLAEIEQSPKARMAAIFRWYFIHSTRLALRGGEEQKADYQIQCGPAMGAFNTWVKGSRYEDWRCRHVDEIGMLLLQGAEEYIHDALSRNADAVAG